MSYWTEEKETYVAHECRYTITLEAVFHISGVCFLAKIIKFATSYNVCIIGA